MVTTKIILVDLDTYPMNYWLGRASYFEQNVDTSTDNYTTTVEIPKRNVAVVYVTFDNGDS